VPCISLLIVELWDPLLEPNPRLPNDDDVPSVCPELMCPVNPLRPLTVRDVPPNEELPDEDRPKLELLDPNREPVELPLSEAFEAKRDPVVEEFPKCEPSMFETPRFGEIELRELSALLCPESAEPLFRFPPREFEATEGVLVPRAPFAAEPPAAALPVKDLAFDPAALLFACVPAVFPVLGPRAPPVFPPNECQFPSPFAPVAPRPAGHPDVRAFNEFERPALDKPPLRAFVDELPPRFAFP